MKKILTLLTGSLFAFAASAQFTPDSSVNTTLQDNPSIEEAVPIVSSDNLNTFVTYFNQNGTGTYEFSMQVLDPLGNPAFTPNGLLVSNYPQATSVSTYDMKATKQGGAVAAFVDLRTGVSDIVAYHMSQQGTFLWGNAGIQLNDPAAPAGGYSPSVGILPNGDAVIAWGPDGSPKDWVDFQRISPSGTVAWTGTPKRIIDSAFTASYGRPQVIPTNTDDFFIYYLKQTGFFPPVCNMYMQRFNAAGNPVWAAPVHLSSKTITLFNVPSIVPDGNNGAYIAYMAGNPSNGFYDVFLQHIDYNGNLWSTDGTPACTGVTTQRMSPKVRCSPTLSNPMVVMKETDSGQSSTGVTVQSFDAVTGAALLGPNGYAVTPITAAYDEPYDMQAICGGWVILYARGSFGNNTMYAVKTDTSGVPVWTRVLSSVASNKLRGQLTEPVTTLGMGDQLVAVWEDERSGRGIYAQNISCDGLLGPLINSVDESLSPVSAMTVFPNPSRGEAQVRIFSEETGRASVRLTDMAGRTIAIAEDVRLLNGVNEFRLSALFGTTALSSGTYCLQSVSKAGVQQARVVVR
ncbi:MAG: hypothetical protein RL213_1128 [Bacteroidota bacterium]|jgi:hypothetical protein